MKEQDSIQQQQKERLYCPMGTFLIIFTTSLISLIMFASGKSNDYICDTNQIFFQAQWYRLFTSVYALYSWRDILYWFICTIWLIFLLSDFEKRVSTLYTIFHFFKVNLIIQIVIGIITIYIYETQAVRNSAFVTSGLYPYTMFLFLRNSLINKSEVVFFFCFPMPINKITRGFLGSLLFIYYAPSIHPCIIVSVYWNLTRFECCQKCILKEGSLFPRIVKFFEWIFPIKSSRFITLTKAEWEKRNSIKFDTPEDMDVKQQIEEEREKKNEVTDGQQIN